MKIANKISFSFFVTAITLAVSVTIIFYHIEKENLKTAIFNHLATASQSRAAHIETILKGYKEATAILAAGNVFKDAVDMTKDNTQRIAQANRRIKSTLQALPEISRIRILDKNGIVIVSSHKDISLDKSAEKIFLKGREDIYIEDIHISKFTGNIVISIAAPIFLSGEFAGITVINFNETALFETTTNRTGLGKTGEIYIVNRDGHMITPSRFKEDTFLKVRIDTEVVREAFKAIEKFGIEKHRHNPLLYTNYRGVEVVGIHDHINPMQWILVTEIDKKEAFAPLWKMKNLLIFVAIVTPIAAWLIGIFVGRIISRPIHALHKGSEVIGFGNLDYKVGTNAKDEIGQLSRAFDQMTADLKNTVVSRNYVDNIVGSMTDILVVAAPDGKIEKTNRVVLDVLGYNEQELIGKDVSLLFPEEERAPKGTKLGELVERGILEDYEIYFRAKDDRKVPVLLSGAVMKSVDCPFNGPVKDCPTYKERGVHCEKILGIVYLAKDITERKQAEKALEQAHTNTKSILEKTQVGIVIVGKDRKIRWVNESARRMAGIENVNVLIGKNCGEYLCPADQDRCPILDENKQLDNSERILRRHDGKEIPIIKTVNEITFDNENVLLETFIDNTKSKQAEEKLNQALREAVKSHGIMLSMLNDNNQIREKLEKNLKELKETQGMLVQSEKLASLGSLVSDMAHEVNNPLMIISGNAQLSLMEDFKGRPHLKESFQVIKEECTRAKDIIRRLLVFSKPSKGEIKAVDINKSLDFVVKLLEHQYSLSDIKITKKYTASLPKIEIDEKQMHEVFMNLLKNSEEAMPKGGTITISTSKKDDNIHINFKDTGIGISQKVIKKIFDPFFTTKESGTGLGLSVCYGIVKAHGGEIIYESKMGKGTAAVILLPIY